MKIFKNIERKGRVVLKKIIAEFLKPEDRSSNIKKIRSVLIIRIDERLGNVVLLNSVIKSFIKNRIKTSIIVSKKYGSIYKFNPDIEEIVYFNKKLLFNPVNIFKLRNRLKRKKYDLLFDASNPNDLSTLCFFVISMVNACVKYGYDRKDSGLILNNVVKKPEECHMLEYYSLLFKKLNLKFYKDIRLKLPLNVVNKYRFLHKDNKSKYIIVHPGGRNHKQWQVEKLLRFLKEIKNKNDNFLILLGPDELENEKLFIKKKYMVIKPVDVIDLLAILKTGKIYIGNDSGPMHAAAALDLDIFAIFKPNASVVFKPIAKHFKMVITEFPSKLSVQEVLRDYKKFLNIIKNKRK